MGRKTDERLTEAISSAVETFLGSADPEREDDGAADCAQQILQLLNPSDDVAVD